MTDPGDPVAYLAQIPWAADLLAAAFEFDIDRVDGLPPSTLANQRLTAIAGDGTGGLFCTVPLGHQPPAVAYVSSEGEAGLIAWNLAGSLDLILALPYWRDCLKFSAGGRLDAMTTAALHLEEQLRAETPDIDGWRAQLRGALHVPALRNPLTVLHDTVTAGLAFGPVVDLVSGEPYESLFNTFEPEDNPSWRG